MSFFTPHNQRCTRWGPDTQTTKLPRERKLLLRARRLARETRANSRKAYFVDRSLCPIFLYHIPNACRRSQSPSVFICARSSSLIIWYPPRRSLIFLINSHLLLRSQLLCKPPTRLCKPALSFIRRKQKRACEARSCSSEKKVRSSQTMDIETKTRHRCVETVRRGLGLSGIRGNG